MFTLTQGPPTDQQVMVAWGIAVYMVLAPLIIVTGAVCGRIMRATRRDGRVAGVETAAAPPLSVPRGDRPRAATSVAADIGAAI
jgi:hypothetical protein